MLTLTGMDMPPAPPWELLVPMVLLVVPPTDPTVPDELGLQAGVAMLKATAAKTMKKAETLLNGRIENPPGQALGPPSVRLLTYARRFNRHLVYSCIWV
jgi:hypothetical protein